MDLSHVLLASCMHMQVTCCRSVTDWHLQVGIAEVAERVQEKCHTQKSKMQKECRKMQEGHTRQAYLNASAIGGDKRLHCGGEKGTSKLLLAALPPLHQHHTRLEYTARVSALHPSAGGHPFAS